MNGDMKRPVEWVGAIVAVVLTTAFGGGYLIGLFFPASGANAVDGQMLKEVLLVVVNAVIVGAAVKKGVESGATAALTTPPGPAPVPGQTTTTTTITKPTETP